LVVLDDVRGPDARAVRIFAELAQCATLAKQVPALVQLHANRLLARPTAVVETLGGAERVFLAHERFDPGEHTFVGLMGHARVPPCGAIGSDDRRRVKGEDFSLPVSGPRPSL